MNRRPPDPRSAIPSVTQLAERVQETFGHRTVPHDTAVLAARKLAARLRREKRAELSQNDLNAVLGPLLNPGPKRVINGTGILLHTNLGRAPLEPETITAALAETAGYTNLELDLETGKRGKRDVHFKQLAQLLWDVEDAVLVNNAAAAVCLSLSALAAGGEAVVSRGELIEIGGSFRLPDIMNLAGARLVEVGATNKTRPDDYERAVTDQTRCLMKTHTSNYRIEGFTADTSIDQLVPIGRKHGVPVIMDLGSGLSRQLHFPQVSEPFIEDYLKADPDLLIFSGDKLFGGVQAGIVLGKSEQIQKLRKHPMMRMVRCDKLGISIICRQLAATFLNRTNPLSRLATAALDSLQERARKYRSQLPHLSLEITPDQCFVGGGSLPQEARPSVSLRFKPRKPDAFAYAARHARPPIVGYIRDDHWYLNLASVFADEDDEVIAALQTLDGSCS